MRAIHLTDRELEAVKFALTNEARSLDELLQPAFSGAAAKVKDTPDDFLSFLWRIRQSRDAMNAVLEQIESDQR